MAARAKRLTLLATILGSSVVFIDGTVVNVALPTLRKDLGAGLATEQWVVEGYLLTLGSLILVGGSMADLSAGAGSSSSALPASGRCPLLCAVAPSGGMLIAGRAFQAVTGALPVPSSLAIVTATFEPGERGAAIGTWTAWTGMAVVVGPRWAV